MGNSFSNLISHAIATGSPVAVYAHKSNPNERSVGFIIKHQDGWVLLRTISTNGFDNGHILLRYADIFLIERETRYLQNIQHCIQTNNTEFSPIDLSPDNRFEMLHAVILFCLQKQSLITVKLSYGIQISGFVLDAQENFIEIQNIDSEGNQDGISFISCNDLQTLSFNGLSERRRSEKNTDQNLL